MSIGKWWNSLDYDQKMLKLTWLIIFITIFTFFIGLIIAFDTGKISENTYQTLEQINSNVYQTKPILMESHKCVYIESKEFNSLLVNNNLSQNSYLGEIFNINVKGAPEKSIYMQIQIPKNIKIVDIIGDPDVKIKLDNETYPESNAYIGFWKQEIEPGDNVKLTLLYDTKYNSLLITGGRTFTFSSAKSVENNSIFDCPQGFK
jgi:hypothetical protein